MAFDIDGTLSDAAGHINERTLQMLDRLAAAETCELVLATGRSLGATHELVQQLGLEKVSVVCANGAVLAHVSQTRGVHVVSVEKVDARAIISRASELDPECAIAVEGSSPEFLVNRPFPDGHLMGPWRTVGLDELIASTAFRITVNSSVVTADVSSAFSDLAVLARADIGQRGWFDVLSAGVSKAHALERLRVQQGVAADRTFACGDEINDVEMLRWAWFAAAVEGSPPALVQEADALIPRPSEGGAADFVDLLHRNRWI